MELARNPSFEKFFLFTIFHYLSHISINFSQLHFINNKRNLNMKKLIFPISVALIGLSTAVLPLSGIANSNPFQQILNKITSPNTDWGPCGDPTDKSQNPTPEYFCKKTHPNNLCTNGFGQQLINGCHSAPVHR